MTMLYEEIINRLLDADSHILDGGINTSNTSNTSSNNVNSLSSFLGVSDTTEDDELNAILGSNNTRNTSNTSSIKNSTIASAGNTTGSMGFSQTIQSELIPLLKDDDAFDIFVSHLTKPYTPAISTTKSEKEDNTNNINHQEQQLKIKRSFRTMTLIVNDTTSAQELHQKLILQKQQQEQNNNNHQDEDELYANYLLSPTRAVRLAKQIFASYSYVYQYYQHYEKESNNESYFDQELRAEGLFTTCTSTTQSNDLLSNSTKEDEQNVATPILPHLPHLNKVLSSLLAAFPKQVVLASCGSHTSTTSTSSAMSQTLEPMLNIQKYCTQPYLQQQHHDSSSSYTSPMNVLTDLINMGCTGRKKYTQSDLQQLQQQQQMMMMTSGSTNNNFSLNEHIWISSGHRKKFIRSLISWNMISKFVHAITKWEQNVSENVCDALLSIIDFNCFPQQIHPALMMNGNVSSGGSNNKKNKNDESAGEEELFRSLGDESIITALAQSSYYVINPKDVDDEENNNRADVCSKTLLGLFEIATGKARKVQNMVGRTTDELEQGDDGAIECKAQSKGVEQNEVPGIDDNKLLQAGTTSFIHSTLVANIELIVKAMDIGFIHAFDDEESGDVTQYRAVNHPGRYTIGRPFTSRRLDLITLFTDIICYETTTNGDNNNFDRKSAIKALEAVSQLPVPLLNSEESNDNSSETVVVNPWPGLCDLLFEYPENSLYGVQFYRMIHALCMTNHENSLKMIVQKCKFLSRAIKVCKNKSSLSSRGVLLKCLNALRLHYQSIGPDSFLRHYLDSHDGWKAFEYDLKRMTLEQILPGGGIAIPMVANNEIIQMEVAPLTEVDIDLNTAFAVELGFPSSIIPYEQMKEEFEVVLERLPSESPTKKKKKSKSQKKKKKR